MPSAGPAASPAAPAADRPLSIALGCPGWPPGRFPNGITPYAKVVADQLRGLGHEVAILSERGEPDPAEGVIAIEPLRRAPTPAGRLVDRAVGKLGGDAAERRRFVRSYLGGLRRIGGGRGPDLLEIEEGFGYCRQVERGSSFPVVTRLHGPWFLNAMDVPHDRAYHARVRSEGRAIRDAFAINAPSLDVIERTRAFYGLELPGARAIPSTMPIPAAADAWAADGAEPGTILFVGRFDRHKGGDLVVDAFAELARARPGARLLFAGPDRGVVDDAGRRWGAAEYLADRLGDLGPGRYDYLGAQPSGALPALRRRAAVVVVASRYEVFGLTVSEAMALGCPVVASGTGGIVELIQDGANGLTFEPGRPADLARQLGRLLDDPALAARLGARARLDATARYAPEVVAGQLAAFYRETIGRFAEGRRR